ncbi:MAG: hotdog fold thioesterase [Thiolinea sp.]
MAESVHVPMNPEQFARACSDAMHVNDRAAQMLGIVIAASTPGRAVLRMRIRQDMLNGHDVCHGGMMFALADTAFAHACNNGNR